MSLMRRPCAAAIIAVAAMLPAVAVADSLVVAFDPQGETTSITTSTPFQPVTAYLLLMDPSGDQSINAWECTVEVQTDGPAPLISWTVAANGLNIMQPPEFIVGLPVPLPNTNVVLLATAQIFVPEPDQEIAFHVLPSSYPSLIQPPGYPVQLPDWAPPPGQGFVAMPPASGCTGLPVSLINDDGVDPVLVVTIAGDGDFGTVDVGGQVIRTLQFHNGGDATICGLLSFAGEGFQYQHGTGSWTPEPTWVRLAPGASRAVEVRYWPSSPGLHEGELALDCAGSLASIVLTGSAEMATCDVAPPAIDFGPVDLGTAVTQTVMVTNVGSEPWLGNALLAAGPFQIVAGAGEFALAPGDTHRVSVAFAPPAATNYTATLELGTEHCDDVPLQGVGVLGPAPVCVVTPEFITDLEAIAGLPATTMVVVTNDGDADLSVNARIESAVFAVIDGGGPQVVAPGGVLTVEIRFLADEPGVYDGLLLLGSSSCADVPISATAHQAEFGCDWSGQTVGDWGEQVVGTTSEREFTFRNLGNVPLTDLSFSVSGSAFAIASGAGPVTVAPGDSHVVRVAFSPAATVTYTSALIPSAGACGALPLTGEGVEPPASLGDALVIAFDPQGETTTFTTTAPNQMVTAYLVLLSPNGVMALNGWECTVEVETAGPTPPIMWNVLYNGLNVLQPPQFAVGLPVPQNHQAVRVLATATVFVPSPDQEIALHILPSPYPSIIQPPAYPVQQPVWAGPPGLPFVVCGPASGCATMPVCTINDDGQTPPPQVLITGDPAFGAVPVGDEATRTLTFHNPGSSTFCGEFAFAGPGYAYRHGNGDWTTEATWCRLAPGADLPVEVRFTPQGSGPHHGELILNSCGPVLALSLTGGGGAAPPVSLTPPQVDFGVVAINDLQERTCTIHNEGDVPLLLTPALVEGDDFALVGDTSEFLLPAGAMHDLTVRLISGTVGAQFGRVGFGQPAAPDLLLRATVMPPSDDCAVTLDGNGSGDCGVLAVGSVLTRIARIFNTGTETLAGEISLVGDLEAFAITSGGGWTTLPPGGLHEVTIAVAPPADGLFTATLRTLGGCASVNLAVTGVAPVLACSVVPDSLAFGLHAIGIVVTDTVVVTNTGTIPLDGAATLPPGPFTVITGGGDYTLTPGQSRQLVVAFAPSAVGAFSAVLDLGVDACVDVACQGAGREYGPYCVVVPDAIDGGVVPEQVSVTFPLTVFNQGELPLAVDPQIDAPGFTVVAGGGPHQILAGASLPIVVGFSGPEPGVYTASLSLGSASCTDVLISVTVRAAYVSCNWNSPNPLYVGGHAVGSLTQRDIVLANTGEIALTDVVFALAGEGFHVTAGGGPVTVPVNGFHTVRVVFIPTDIGGFSAQLTSSTACCEPLTLIGDGTGPLPSCSVNPGEVNFVPTCVGSLRPATVQVVNGGPGMLVVFPTVEGAGFTAAWGAGFPLWLQVPAGATRNITVNFAPSATGNYTGLLGLGDSGCNAVPLAGTAIEGEAVCTVDATALDFGEVELGYLAERQLHVTNDGCIPLAIAPAISGDGFQIFTGGEAGEIAPGESRTIVVHLLPEVLGPATGSLDLGGPDCPAIPLAGQCIPISLTCYTLPAYLNVDFLPLSQTRTRAFSIHNAGSADVTLEVASVPGLADVLTGGGSFTLQPGATRTVQASFRAPAYGQTIWQWSFGAGCRPLMVVVYGADAICHVRPAYIDFGTTTLGSAVVRNWVVSNPGVATVTYTLGCADPNYEWSPSGTQTLEPGHAYSGLVTYAPQAAGTHDTRLEFNSETAYPIDMHGVAVDRLALKRFDVARLDFGALSPGEELTRSCLLRNESSEVLSGEVTLSSREFRIIDGAGQISVPAGGSRAVRVRYSSSRAGDHTAILSLAGTELTPVTLRGRCFVAESDSNRVAIVWDDGADAMSAGSDHFAERELSGRVVLRDPSGTMGLFAWQGRLIASGSGQFTDWQLPAGATNQAAAPRFDVVMNGDIPPLAREITLATFRYVVPAGGQADFLLAGVAGEEPLGWPTWCDAAEPDSALVAPSATGEHLVAMVRPDGDQVVPGLLRLHPPYPNPFNPMTTVAFDLGEPGHAQLAIFDLAGRRVTTLVDAELPVGRHEYTWLGRDEGGQAVPSGTYHVRLLTGSQTRTSKVSLVR
jgi:hypothetical protein